MARRRNLAAAVSAAKQDDDAPQGEHVTGPKPAPTIKNPSLGLASLGGRTATARTPNPMAAREGALADVASGRVRDVRLRQVDPATCRMWEKHDRLYERLTPVSCEDLISSIKAQGRQEVPALVRRLKDDPEGYEYEVIAGARRHYAVSYLRETEHRDIPFVVEVREMADEEAFRFSDLENRSRQDISDYERGRKYLAALADYYGANQTRMAERMEVSKSLLSSYLSVARLPQAIIDAYGDPRGISVRHGQQLSPLLNGTGAAGLLERASLIAEAQARQHEAGADYLPGPEVFKMLIGLRPRADGKPKPQVFRAECGRTVLTARPGKGRLVLDVDMTASEAEVIEAVKAAYRGAA